MTSFKQQWTNQKCLDNLTVQYVQLSRPHGNLLAAKCSHPHSHVRLFNSTNFETVLVIETDQMDCIAFSDHRLITGDAEGRFSVWDISDQTVLRQTTAHKSGIKCMDCSPWPDYFATGSNCGEVKLWDIKNKRCVFNYVGHCGPIECVNCIESMSNGQKMLFRKLILEKNRNISFSPDGRWLASADSATLILWDITIGKELARFDRPQSTEPKSAAFSILEFHPEHCLLLSASISRICVHCLDSMEMQWSGEAGPGLKSILVSVDDAESENIMENWSLIRIFGDSCNITEAGHLSRNDVGCTCSGFDFSITDARINANAEIILTGINESTITIGNYKLTKSVVNEEKPSEIRQNTNPSKKRRYQSPRTMNQIKPREHFDLKTLKETVVELESIVSRIKSAQFPQQFLEKLILNQPTKATLIAIDRLIRANKTKLLTSKLCSSLIQFSVVSALKTESKLPVRVLCSVLEHIIASDSVKCDLDKEKRRVLAANIADLKTKSSDSKDIFDKQALIYLQHLHKHNWFVQHN